MNPDRLPHLGDFPDEIREQSAEVKQTFSEWWRAVREDPSLIWNSQMARVCVWLFFGLIAFVIVYWVTHKLSPATTMDVDRQATSTATLYVACSNHYCLKSYTIERPMDFKDWPVQCDHCAQLSVYRAKPCPECRRWIALLPGKAFVCPFCKQRKDNSEEKPEKTGIQNPDDDEDPWD